MTVSDQIRSLAREGLSTAEIARRLGIRYQHAYNVLHDSSVAGTANLARTPIRLAGKPCLSPTILLAGGFKLSSRWKLSETVQLILDQPVSKEVGVYAFARDEIVLYVGVATMGLAKRLNLYAKPDASQRTNQRLNEIMRKELEVAPHIDVYTAAPPDFDWNGLPVHGSAGLELGLIKKYDLPWNVRSAR